MQGGKTIWLVDQVVAEMDSLYNKLWKDFDIKAINEDIVAAKIDIVLSIAQSILYFARNGER